MESHPVRRRSSRRGCNDDASLARRLQQQEYNRTGYQASAFELMVNREAFRKLTRKWNRKSRRLPLFRINAPILRLATKADSPSIVVLRTADQDGAAVSGLNASTDTEKDPLVTSVEWSQLASLNSHDALAGDCSPEQGTSILALCDPQSGVYCPGTIVSVSSRGVRIRRQNDDEEFELGKRVRIMEGSFGFVPSVIQESPVPLSSECKDLAAEIAGAKEKMRAGKRRREREMKVKTVKSIKAREKRKRRKSHKPQAIHLRQIKNAADLGLVQVESLLAPEKLNAVREVCKQLQTLARERSPECKIHQITRATQGTSGSAVAVSIGDNIKNGTQIYVTKDGKPPAWNRNLSIPQSWVERINAPVEWLASSSVDEDSSKITNASVSENPKADSIVIGESSAAYGLPKPVPGRCSVRHCNTVSIGAYCKHCRMPAARASKDQWKTLMSVIEAATRIGALPSTKTLENGQIMELNVLAFVVLDYGYIVPVPKTVGAGNSKGPGIPLHQDTSCLGEAIGSLLIDGDDKTVDVLYDTVELNGSGAGRCVSFAHKKNSFYTMTENTRWLARHRVRHVTGKKRSLGLLVRLNWRSRRARINAEIIKAAGVIPPKNNLGLDQKLKGERLFGHLQTLGPWYKREDFMYDEGTWDVDGLLQELKENKTEIDEKGEFIVKN